MPDAKTISAPVIVIGGGISGLACAFRLKQRGIPFLLLEKSNRFGGVVQSIQQDGFLFERGPQSFTLTSPLNELIEATGLSGELLRAPSRMPRYIYVGGKLVAAPMSPFSLLTTSLLSPSTKWNLLTEPLRRTHPPNDDESIASFVRRKFGASLLDNLAAPFVSGVYAGDPEKLSLRSAFPQVHEWEKNHGSLLRGAIRKMRSRPKNPGAQKVRGICSLTRGVSSLFDALGANLGDSVHLGVGVEAVIRNTSESKERFEVRCTFSGTQRTESLAASAVICATETAPAGAMLAPSSEQFTKSLARIPYAPIAVVSAGYRRETVGRALDGFGFLVPRSEGLRVLGCVWNSALFPGRAPEDHVLLTSFAGGALNPEMCTWSEERIASAVHQDISRVLNIKEEPVVQNVHVHQRAIPQYNLGHFRILTELQWSCDATPGLYLAGNYLDGPSMGACVERSFRVVDEVENYLNRVA
nr:protoporphyrinogen oxidase [Candidatus Acidoferrales bacterium]